MLIAFVGLFVAFAKTISGKLGLSGLLINVFLFSVFSAGYLETQFLLRFLLAAIVVLLGVVWVFSDAASTRRERNVAIVLVVASAIMAVFINSAEYEAPGESDKMLRYVFLLPAAFVVGTQLHRPGVIDKWIESYRFWTVGMSGFAIVEFINGANFFPRRNWLESLEGLSTRTLLLSEHSLVLAALLLAGLPFVLLLKHRGIRFGLVVLLGVGVWTSGSSGPLGLYAMFIVIFALRRLLRFDLRRWAKVLSFCVGSLLIGLTTLGTVLSYQSNIVTSPGNDSSAEYRVALYSSMWQTLTHTPWGYGISGLPAGVLVIPSAFGHLDLARTIDSEFVLLAVELGWIGIAVGFGLFMLCFSGPVLKNPVGQSTMLITTAGLFLALHAWLGLGTLWILLIGSSFALYRKTRRAVSTQPDSRLLISSGDRRPAAASGLAPASEAEARHLP